MSENKNKNTQQSFGPRRGPGRGGPGGSIGMPVEKAKDFKGTLKRLLKYINPYKVLILISFLFASLGTVFNLFGPKIMGYAIDSISKTLDSRLKGINIPMDYQYLGELLFILLGLYLMYSVFTYLMQFIMVGISQKTVYNMRKEVSNKLTKLPLKYYDSHIHGDILSRVTNDIDNISNTLQQSINQIITSIVTIIGMIIMMLSISPILTLITLITLPLSVLVTSMVAKKSQKHFKEQQKVLGKLNGHVEEMYTGHKIVKVFNYEEKSQQKFDELNQGLFNAGYKAQFISGTIMPLMTFVGNIGYVIVCAVGGVLATSGAITLGSILAFIQYSRQFTQPIIQIANIANIIQSTIASAERVFEVLDEVEEVEESKEQLDFEKIEGNVAFENVKFSYKDDIPLIKCLNINIKSGQTIAIVGPTGAGKTTLVNLLLRFYEIKEGKITIDGRNITDFTRGSLRNIFGMVLQDTWLFKGTIKENIAYGKLDADDDEIICAAKTAYADHFIRTLPDGYDTVLNEEADNISQGQKQLLTIARAILANPQIMILDEATSSVDTRTEKYIQKATDKIMQGRTNFVIAHRLSTIVDADVILVMNEGDIIEQGSHSELLEKNGFYAELYNSQFAIKKVG